MTAHLIDAEGTLPLPWIEAPLLRALAAERSHALLLCAAPGAGALPLALSLAQSRLCESPGRGGLACGRCGSCRLVQAQGHPDLFVLLPEVERRETGWLVGEDRPEGEEGKRKPSRQIRIDDVRGLLDWVSKTSSRGRGKVVVLHPAEALNHHAASALLKTVEEPPAGTRLVLTCSDAMHVMPTVRSRCQQQAMPTPDRARAAAWLAGHGVAQPEVLLAACDDRPLEVLGWQQRGIDAERWAALPRQLGAGRAGMLAGASVPQAVELLLKVCHDAMAAAVSGRLRYFAADNLPEGLSLPGLCRWHRELQRLAEAAEHPWHEALAVDALVSGAQRALSARPAAGR
jgi:DNA polymerase-3 subunit delta'